MFKRILSRGLGALLVLLFTITGSVLLIVSLYRILNDRYDRAAARLYYKKTLNFFLWGVILSFSGGLLRMLQALFLS